MTNSTSYANDVRAVNQAFATQISKSPVFAGMIPFSPVVLRSRKLEWINDTDSQTVGIIQSFVTDGNGTGIVVDDGTKFRAGMLLKVRLSTGATKTEQMRVVSVSSNTLTVERDYASTTGVTLSTGWYLVPYTKALGESSDPDTEFVNDLSLDYNYSQILDVYASVSRTAMSVNYYGMPSGTALLRETEKEFIKLSRQLNGGAINGYRVQRTSSVKGSFMGVNEALSGGNIEATGGALSLAHFDGAHDLIYTDTSNGGAYFALMSSVQGGKLASLARGSGSDGFRLTQDVSNQSLGRTVYNIEGSLPIGMASKVVIDNNHDDDKISILDMNKFKWHLMDDIELKDATPSGRDGRAVRGIIEISLEIKDRATAHAQITGLNV